MNKPTAADLVGRNMKSYFTAKQNTVDSYHKMSVVKDNADVREFKKVSFGQFLKGTELGVG